VISDIIQSCSIVIFRGVLTFGVFFYGSHFLPIADVGLLAQVFAYIFVLTAVFDSGYGFLLLRDLKMRGGKVLSEITTHKLVVNCIFLSIVLIILFIFAPNNLFLYLIACLTSVLISFQNFFGVYCRADSKFGLESSALFIQCFLLVLLTVVCHEEINILKTLLIIMCVRFVGVLYIYFNIQKQIFFKVEKNDYILRNSLTYGLVIVLSTIYFQIDTIIISNMNSIEAAGFYQNAIRLAVIGMMLIEMTNQVFQPALVDKYLNKPQSFLAYQKLVQRFYTSLSMFICIFLIYFSKPIISFLYGPNFYILEEYLPLVCMILMLRTFGLSVSLPISLDQSVWPRIKCVFFAALVAFSMNFIFIGLLKYDWVVAFYISILVHLIVNTWYFLFAKIKVKTDFGFKAFLVSCLILLVLSFSSRDSSLFLIAGAIAVSASIFFLKKINEYNH
jgi:O-antigen/teichoic acid export membrane protein